VRFSVWPAAAGRAACQRCRQLTTFGEAMGASKQPCGPAAARSHLERCVRRRSPPPSGLLLSSCAAAASQAPLGADGSSSWEAAGGRLPWPSPTILEYYADWCEVCPGRWPAMEAIETEHRGASTLVLLNVDNPRWSPEIEPHRVTHPQAGSFSTRRQVVGRSLGRPQPLDSKTNRHRPDRCPPAGSGGNRHGQQGWRSHLPPGGARAATG